MITVGYSKIDNYLLWVTPASLSDKHLDPNSVNKDYYLVLLLKQKDGYNFYVSLKDCLKLDNRNYPSKDTDLKEFEFYSSNKGSPFHLWKLNKTNVESLTYQLLNGLK